MLESMKQYAVAVAKRWRTMAFSLIGIVGVVVDIWQGFDVPVWIWVVIIIVPLFIAQFLAYRQLWVELEKQKQSNWISAHEMERGELPPVPSFMSDVVSNYSPGMLVSKNIQLITPSAHFWEKRRPSEKKQLLELAEWLGQDPRDYEARIKKMSPPSGTSMRLHRK